MSTPRQTRASKLSAQSQIVTRHTKPSLKKPDKLSPMDAPIVKEINDDGTIVWNEDTEPILFRNVLKLKPVGPMKHWRMLVVRKRVSQELDYPVSTQAIWNHLSTLYDLKSLDDMETADKVDKVEPFTLPKSILQIKLKGLDTSSDQRSRKNSNTCSTKGDTDMEGEDFTAPSTPSAGKKSLGPQSPKPLKRRTNTPTLSKKFKVYDSVPGGTSSDLEMDDMGLFRENLFGGGRTSASEYDLTYDDDNSNQDSTSELEELSRKSSFSKSFSPYKRKSDVVKKGKTSTTTSDRPDTPSDSSSSSKRSRTPVGVPRVKRQSDFAEDGSDGHEDGDDDDDDNDHDHHVESQDRYRSVRGGGGGHGSSTVPTFFRGFPPHSPSSSAARDVYANPMRGRDFKALDGHNVKRSEGGKTEGKISGSGLVKKNIALSRSSSSSMTKDVN